MGKECFGFIKSLIDSSNWFTGDLTLRKDESQQYLYNIHQLEKKLFWFTWLTLRSILWVLLRFRITWYSFKTLSLHDWTVDKFLPSTRCSSLVSFLVVIVSIWTKFLSLLLLIIKSSTWANSDFSDWELSEMWPGKNHMNTRQMQWNNIHS